MLVKANGFLARWAMLLVAEWGSANGYAANSVVRPVQGLVMSVSAR